MAVLCVLQLKGVESKGCLLLLSLQAWPSLFHHTRRPCQKCEACGAQAEALQIAQAEGSAALLRTPAEWAHEDCRGWGCLLVAYTRARANTPAHESLGSGDGPSAGMGL